MSKTALKHREDFSLSETINLSSSQRPSLQSWLIWACAGIFYLYEMVLRASPSVMTHELMHDFMVASTALGVLSSCYYYAYVVLQIPCGLIVDWLGTRRVITFSAALCTLGSVFFALSESLFLAQVGRFLIGAGSACAFISCLKIGAQWFLPAQFALIAGLTNMMGTLGGTFSGPPFALLVNTFGWRQAMLIAAFIGIGVTFVSWVFIRERQESAESPSIFKTGFSSLFDGLKSIASKPQNWMLAVFGGLMYVPISAFCELWAVPFLMQTYNINNQMASTASVMIFIGTAVGSPLAAWLCDFWKSRLKVMSLSAICTMIMFALIVLIEDIDLTTMHIFLLMAGVASSGQVLCFTAIKEMTCNSLSATAVGFTNAVVMMSGIIFQPLLGMVLDLCWDGSFMADGVTRLYTAAAYQSAIMAVPVGVCVSWILLWFAKETYQEHE